MNPPQNPRAAEAAQAWRAYRAQLDPVPLPATAALAAALLPVVLHPPLAVVREPLQWWCSECGAWHSNEVVMVKVWNRTR